MYRSQPYGSPPESPEITPTQADFGIFETAFAKRSPVDPAAAAENIAIYEEVFPSLLVEALLEAQEDIAKGRRFRARRWTRSPHWPQALRTTQIERPRGEAQRSPIPHLTLDSRSFVPQVSASSSSEQNSRQLPSPVIPPARLRPPANEKMAARSPQRNSGGISPSSSPRLPSPPPFTEVQFGPKSPSVSGAVSEFSLDASKIDDGASRRIRPGSKASEMAKGPPFVPLHQLESPFQLQEYLSALYHKLIRDEKSDTVNPIDKEMALEMATPPTAQDTGEVVDRNLWLYELCRFLCNKTTRIIVAFFNDSPPCSQLTCPEMRASEWQYLCAVHEPPKSCCAIDYCNHTLDWASNILTSNKHFPSRLSLGGDGGNAYQSMRQLTNIFRRVYRIYAHAWFQHREVFWSIESELGLYKLFKTVCDQYQLIPEDNYTIPPEAEGERDASEDTAAAAQSPEKIINTPAVLRREGAQPEEQEENAATNTVSTGATTRRHKHTPSTGVPVAVIAEGHESDEEETTMVDLGRSIPAQPRTASLSPPKVDLERTKSPGVIEIPKNDEPERYPEDPTPVAHHEFNPFGSPGPAESLDTAQSTTKANLASSDDLNAITTGEAETTKSSEVLSNDPLSKEALDTVTGQLHDVSVNGANPDDSDAETQVAVGDDEGEKHELNEDDETMGEIDINEISGAKKEEDAKTATGGQKEEST